MGKHKKGAPYRDGEGVVHFRGGQENAAQELFNETLPLQGVARTWYPAQDPMEIKLRCLQLVPEGNLNQAKAAYAWVMDITDTTMSDGVTGPPPPQPVGMNAPNGEPLVAIRTPVGVVSSPSEPIAAEDEWSARGFPSPEAWEQFQRGNGLGPVSWSEE